MVNSFDHSHQVYLVGGVLVRARAVAQRLRDLAVDLGSVPSTHMAAHNSLSKGSGALFWPPQEMHACGA